jgi:hypothetical protein
MVPLGETRFGLLSVMPTAMCLPRVSSDFHSGSGVGAGAGASVAVAVGDGVGDCWARGLAGSSFSPHAERASAIAPAPMAKALTWIGPAA